MRRNKNEDSIDYIIDYIRDRICGYGIMLLAFLMGEYFSGKDNGIGQGRSVEK